MPHSAAPSRSADRPLVVRLEGTLIFSSIVWEAIVSAVRHRFALAFMLAFWRLAGQRYFQQKLATLVDIDAATLPYNAEVLALLNREISLGRTIVLATTGPRCFAEKVASRLPLFSDVIVVGHPIAPALDTTFGPQNYDCHRVPKRPWRRPLLAAMRPRQWLKNLLVFVPMLAAHALDRTALIASLLAFIVFCLAASGAYLLNDTLDAAHDRMHRTKFCRPLAAATLPIPVALGASGLLTLTALAGCLWLAPLLCVVLCCYFLVTVSYSIHLKRLPMVDIVTLAVLYSARILGGCAGTKIEPSFWLLAFSFFIFLSLALLKRHSELLNLQRDGEAHTRGRGYLTSDKTPIGIMGLNSGFLSVLIFILYFHSGNVLPLYPHPAYLMGVVPLLVFWLGHLWMLSFRGEVNEDPVLYVSRDRVSWAVIGSCAALAAAASF